MKKTIFNTPEGKLLMVGIGMALLLMGGVGYCLITDTGLAKP